MPGPNQDPNATAGVPHGPDHGGNTDQPEPTDGESGSSGGMTTGNSGALVGATGLAKAKKSQPK